MDLIPSRIRKFTRGSFVTVLVVQWCRDPFLINFPGSLTGRKSQFFCGFTNELHPFDPNYTALLQWLIIKWSIINRKKFASIFFSTISLFKRGYSSAKFLKASGIPFGLFALGATPLKIWTDIHFLTSKLFNFCFLSRRKNTCQFFPAPIPIKPKTVAIIVTMIITLIVGERLFWVSKTTANENQNILLICIDYLSYSN